MPPLCRDAAGHIAHSENGRLIRHLEAGGVRTLLYGGNANLYNASLSEYEEILDALEDHSGPDTAIVPSVGPYFGTMMDQAAILAKRDFPTVMILPTVAVSTPGCRSKSCTNAIRLRIGSRSVHCIAGIVTSGNCR